jgi:hypothetical protein
MHYLHLHYIISANDFCGLRKYLLARVEMLLFKVLNNERSSFQDGARKVEHTMEKVQEINSCKSRLRGASIKLKLVFQISEEGHS